MKEKHILEGKTPSAPILPNFSKMGNIFTFHEYKTYNPLLNEAVYKTYEPSYVLKHICGYLRFTTDFEEYAINTDKYHGFIHLEEVFNGMTTFQCIIPNNTWSKTQLDRVMWCCGYYESTEEPYKYNNAFLQIVYEKNYDGDNVNNIAKTKGSIYHMTSACNVEKILKNGLSPKHKDKIGTHPDRVYFYLYYGFPYIFKAYAKEFYDAAINKNNEEYAKLKDGKPNRYRDDERFFDSIKNYVVLEITTHDLDVDFFYDPNMENAVYTRENIPPKYISVKEKITL